jgi:hypothetical protein
MKGRFWSAAVLLCVLALVLTGCIGREKARSQLGLLADYYTVTFYEDDVILSQTRVAEGQAVESLPNVDVTGWLTADGEEVDPLTVAVTEDMGFYAADHQATALTQGHVGFMPITEEEFHPSQAVTRAELAAVLYRLVPQEERPEQWSNPFSDAPEGDAVYYPAVLTMAEMDVLSGYPDGTYRPDQAATRAELLMALYRLTDEEGTASASFGDVSADYWAYDAIAYGAAKGWVSGYGDGNFYPEAPVTRAELAVIVERFLSREPDKTAIDSACPLPPYRDVWQGHWAYYEIVEASYTNDFLAYIWGEAQDVQPGFLLLDDELCHVNSQTLGLDYYEAGFHTIDGGLYYVSQDGYFIQRFQQGLLELDGSMFYVTEDDGPFLTDDSFGYLTFGEDGRYTSGSDYVDEKVDEILADILYDSSLTQEEKLYKAYCSIRDGGYFYLTRATGWQRGTTSWSLGCAEVMYETKGGTCYYWASALLYLCRRLGYQAYPVCGGVGTKNQIHAWVVIEWDDGEEYIFDVELEWAYARGFYNGNYSPTDMFKQPRDNTKVIYVFPGETATYYGVEDANDDEDALDVPEEEQVPPEATDAPQETETPTDPDDPDATVSPENPDATQSPDNTADPTVTDTPAAPDDPSDSGTTGGETTGGESTGGETTGGESGGTEGGQEPAPAEPEPVAPAEDPVAADAAVAEG